MKKLKVVVLTLALGLAGAAFAAAQDKQDCCKDKPCCGCKSDMDCCKKAS